MMEEEGYSSVLFIKSEEAKPRDDQSRPGPHRYGCAVVVLGLLTALLLSALVTLLVYYQGYVSEYSTLLARYDNASAANQDLQKERNTLMMERDHLNQTLEVIFQFRDFPVDHFCPVSDHVAQERKCGGYCTKGWMYYQSSCYQFINTEWQRESWEFSQADCEMKRAHLVTIDTVEEQAFIYNHTYEYYYEQYGYWIGLRKIQDKWQWLNGSELTGGHWIRTEEEEGDGCVLSMPNTDPLKSWQDSSCHLLNRWICEKEAAKWPGKNDL
ncbi:asialoglycoprotein receptor 2-like isoform X2 [Sardina pilchardus]|uniref:asialoglycoprotein receptor 2-like isoform X2 n=1 Tax=Sardina pilchardus TaxID=27697 RepID=UPI002E103607